MKGVEGSMQDYGLRMYDPRVGRFFSADPLMFNYPYYTPYQFAGNMPISATDLDGGEPREVNPTSAKGGGSRLEKSTTTQNRWNTVGDFQKILNQQSGGGAVTIPNAGNKLSYQTIEADKATISKQENDDPGNGDMKSQSEYDQFCDATISTQQHTVTDFIDDPPGVIWNGIKGIGSLLKTCFSSGIYDPGMSKYGSRPKLPFLPIIARMSTWKGKEWGKAVGGIPVSIGAGIYTGQMFPANGRLFVSATPSQTGIVYRALTLADRLNYENGMGLVAKNPLGNWELDMHLINGSSKAALTNSPWISTTTDLSIAQSFSSGNGILVIDLSLIPESNIGIGFMKYHRFSPAYHYSVWQCEVSIFQHIPATAIKGLIK